jgi:hypothetical protein
MSKVSTSTKPPCPALRRNTDVRVATHRLPSSDSCSEHATGKDRSVTAPAVAIEGEETEALPAHSTRPILEQRHHTRQQAAVGAVLRQPPVLQARMP